jgi:hypothetical protein
MNSGLEAECVQGYLALFAKVHRLHVWLLAQRAVPAVPALVLAGGILLRVGDPVVKPVKPESIDTIIKNYSQFIIYRTGTYTVINASHLSS